jgi:hypothetical protein
VHLSFSSIDKMKPILLLAGVAVASAHTIFVALEVDGVNNGVSQGVRTPTYDGPQTDVQSNSLACNGPPNPTTPTDKLINVTAGSTVNAIWRHTLTSGPSQVMDPSHKGPAIAYLKKVDDARKDAGYGAGWFKIQEDGYSGGIWGTDKVIQNQGKHAIKIPNCIEPGQYLLRAEMIALHGAGSYPGAQLYMECAQINIVGGNATKKPTTYSIPGIYKVKLLRSCLGFERERSDYTDMKICHRELTQASPSIFTTHQSPVTRYPALPCSHASFAVAVFSFFFSLLFLNAKHGQDSTM